MYENRKRTGDNNAFGIVYRAIIKKCPTTTLVGYSKENEKKFDDMMGITKRAEEFWQKVEPEEDEDDF